MNVGFDQKMEWKVCKDGYRIAEVLVKGQKQKVVQRKSKALTTYDLNKRIKDLAQHADDLWNGFDVSNSDRALSFISEFGFVKEQEAEFELVTEIVNEIRAAASIPSFVEIGLTEGSMKAVQNSINRSKSIENFYSNRISIETIVTFRQDPDHLSTLRPSISFKNLASRLTYEKLFEVAGTNGHRCKSCGNLIVSKDPRKVFCNDQCKTRYHNRPENRRKKTAE